MSKVYLDANASEPLRPEARAALLAALSADANPASVHAPGRAARVILDAARDSLAARFGAHPARLVFTSGGAEANALAIHALGMGALGMGALGMGALGMGPLGEARRLVVSAIEHDSVLAASPGAALLPVDADGVVRLAELPALLAKGPNAKAGALVCLMAANNETGAIQPIAEAAAICRAHGALLHVDAIQAAGRIPLDLARLGADSLALSGHKLGGPLGAGALLFAADPPVRPLIPGGGQERGMRGGTPPLPAIAGMAAAAEIAWPELAELRDAAERAAVASGGVVIAAAAPRLANTLCVALPGVAAATQVMALDLAGIAVSAGAACSSGRVAASHVLRAMGLGALAGEAIRVSLPWNTTPADIDAFATAYAAMASRATRRAA